MLQADTPDDYVVATGVSHSVEHLLDTAFKHVDLNYKDYVKIDPALIRPAEVDYLCGDASKITKALGWKPETTFEKLIAMMVEADLEQNRLHPKGSHVATGM
jgi:GDPmannose 4,6-dehydratase